MTLIGIIAVIVLSLLLTAIFVFGLRTKGPWGSAWSFFMVIILSLWTVSLWVPPAGPVWWGAAWIDLLMTGLLVAFILSAVTPSGRNSKSVFKNESDFGPEDVNKDEFADLQPVGRENKVIVKAGGLFWMLLLVLCVLIIIGAT